LLSLFKTISNPLFRQEDAGKLTNIFHSLFVYVLAFVVCFDSLNVFGLISIGPFIVNVFKIINFVFLLIYIIYQRHTISSKDWLLALALLPFLWVQFADSGNPVLVPLKSISRFGPTLAFILLSLDLKIRVAKIWFNFFVFSLLPGLFIHIFKLALSVDFPTIELTNVIGEEYSTHFFLYFFNKWNYIRYCAIYDEPGVVGTFALLFLIFWDGAMSRPKKIILWLSGIATLSFYFLASIPLFFIYKMLQAKRYLWLIFFALCTVLLAVNAESILQRVLQKSDQSTVYEDLVFQALLTRLTVDEKSSEGGISLKTNRLNADTYSFETFKKEDPMTILFGNFLTKGAKEFGDLTGSGLGQEMFLYENGVLLYLYAWFFIGLLCLLPAKNNKFFIASSFFFIALCFYQRPFLYRADFMVIIYMGILLLNQDYRRILIDKFFPASRSKHALLTAT